MIALRAFAFVALGCALALALPPAADAQMGERGKRGTMGGGKQGGGMMGGRRQLGGEAAVGPDGRIENPMHPRAPLELKQRRGLVPTGLQAVYPEDAECLEGASFFADKTRYDGSARNPDANHGYHEGLDISAPIGTPLIALADGEVVHKYEGGRLVGIQIILRHAPEDTGLPVYIYSKYKHFDRMPEPEVGQRVTRGQVLGPSGRTGTIGGHYGSKGYPHLHLSIYVSDSAEYKTLERSVLPENVRFLDPLALYARRDPPLLDNHAARALPAAAKRVLIRYMTTDGRVVPEGTRLVWPFACAPR